jgi:toxin ParE1/3/4
LWRVHLAAAAEADFRDIMQWTLQQFGETQARTYAQTLSAALTSLSEGPAAAGVRARDDIAKGLFTLHSARNGRKARHFILFRTARVGDQQIIEVLRVLHDAMDLARHLPPDQD